MTSRTTTTSIVTVVRATMRSPAMPIATTQPDMTFTAGADSAYRRKRGYTAGSRTVNSSPTNSTSSCWASPMSQLEYALKVCRMRFRLNADGTLRGILGGYQNWRTLYASWALGGLGLETMLGFDMPGLYYALKKSADGYPDPRTGEKHLHLLGIPDRRRTGFPSRHPAGTQELDTSGGIVQDRSERQRARHSTAGHAPGHDFEESSP